MVLAIEIGKKLLVYCHPTLPCRFQLMHPAKRDDSRDPVLMSLLLCSITGRGHPRQANAVSRVASLPPSRTPAVPILAASAPADLTPAGASPDGPEPRFIMSLFLQKITPGGHSGRANAVFRVASSGEKHSIFNHNPWPISVNLAVV